MASIDKLNRFVMNPTSLDIGRSRFPRPFNNTTTMVAGKMVPVYLDEVLPGDTFDVSTSAVIRSITPAVPVMDNSFMDIYYFFVPFRLCTNDPKDWPKICGENFEGFWANQTEETLESTGNTVNLTQVTIEPQSLANYLGIPSGSYGSGYSNLNINSMPMWACLAIWNDWFRDENTQAPIDIPTYLYDSELYGQADALPDVNKFHDYFCSALQSPQKGDAVVLPLVGMAPVRTDTQVHDVIGAEPLKMYSTAAGQVLGDSLLATDSHGQVSIATNNTHITEPGRAVPGNLWADLSQTQFTNINEIRQAFAIQRMLEKDARGGKVCA